MGEQPRKQITRLLAHLDTAGDQCADAAALERVASELFPLVYDQLKAIAESYFRRQPADHTLQPTAVVHEAYLRLVGQPDAKWNSRAHFLAVAAKAMRQILIDHARRRHAARRGGDHERRTFSEALTPAPESPIDLLVLDDALTRLAHLSERMARVVELRYFGGLTVAEVAEVLAVSKRTVEGDWETARAWLARELNEGDAP